MTLEFLFDPSLGLLEVLPGSTNIPEGSFKQRDDIQMVIFPDDLDTIDSNAFAYCRNLKTLNLPDSLSSIGKEAFFANFSLESLVIPDSVVSIGDYAFQYGRSLQSVHIGDAVTSIGKRTFSNAWVLSDLKLGDSLTTIGEKAFYRNPQLIDVTIPDSVTRIGNEAFAGTGITSVVLPNHFLDNPPTAAFEPGTDFSYRSEPSLNSGEITKEGWQSNGNSGLWTAEADRLDSLPTTESISWTVAEGQKVDTLEGSDRLKIEGADRPALINAGSLKMSRGKDHLRLRVNVNATALLNDGTINMGKGRDQIDLITGSLAGGGTIKLGPGNDRFSGFGQQSMLNGGKGRDELRLPTGRYELLPQEKRWLITRDESAMVIRSIEAVGGLQTPEASMLQIEDLDQASTLLVDQSSISWS